MELKALDTIHISSARPDAIRPGETFEVEPDAARSLIARGLAAAVDGKADPPPQNKALRPAKNKGA